MKNDNKITNIDKKLELLTQTPASQWLALQSKYDMYTLEQGKGFVKYKKAINDWVSKSLPLEPEKRRVDKVSIALVAKATELANQISQDSKLV